MRILLVKHAFEIKDSDATHCLLILQLEGLTIKLNNGKHYTVTLQNRQLKCGDSCVEMECSIHRFNNKK